jgi:copper chaperone
MTASSSYTVEGMTCNSCVTKVTNAVAQIPGVEDIDVDIETGALEVIGSAEEATVRATIQDLGYRIAAR